MARGEKIHGVNITRLKFAREYYGLTKNFVESKLSIDIDSFELGELNPTYVELSKLSTLYKRPLLYFFFKDTPRPNALQVAFRSMESELGESFDIQVRIMMEKAYEYQMNLTELFLDEKPPKFFSLLEENDINNNEELILFLRSKLRLSISEQKNTYKKTETLLEYLREQLYSIGIYVFKDSFKADNISGLCLYHNDYPVILLNNKTTFTRQLFTIFHEIYHLWRREADVYIPKYNVEKECDKFAGEFLIPTDDLAKTINQRKDCEQKDLIDELAEIYKVSPEAIAYKLKSLGKISNEFYKTIRQDGIRKMNTESSGGNFYYTRMSYLGKPYLKHVFTKYYNGKISITTVGKYTGLKAAHVARLSSNMFGGAF